MDERDEMRSALTEEERSLTKKIERHEDMLDDLARELKVLDGEVAELSQDDSRFDALRNACAALEELDKLDGGDLFWGEGKSADALANHLEIAHKSTEAFSADLAHIEERRASVFEQIGDQNEILDCLDYELRDVMEREERRQTEWLVECDPRPIPDRRQIMPWARGYEEDQVSNRMVSAAVVLCLLLGVALPMVDLPLLERSKLIEVPERVATLIRKELAPTPPPEPVIVPEPVPEEIEPEPVLAEEEPPPDQVVETVEEAVVAEVVQPESKEQVKSKGILAFRDSFASRATNRPTAQLGSQARLRNAGQDSVGRPERSMVSTSAPGSSGGINLAELSRDVGGGSQAIEGVALARVASSIGGEFGSDRPLSSGPSAGRTDEEIQIVFDRYKAALYRLYNRELRKDPTLRGQLVLRLTIEPDGSVSLCQLQTSDMDAPLLAQQVVDRVSNFDFGAKDGIVAMTIIYPIDFLPAA
jgi:outer membrane biosynthesis protein TonB